MFTYKEYTDMRLNEATLLGVMAANLTRSLARAKNRAETENAIEAMVKKYFDETRAAMRAERDVQSMSEVFASRVAALEQFLSTIGIKMGPTKLAEETIYEGIFDKLKSALNFIFKKDPDAVSDAKKEADEIIAKAKLQADALVKKGVEVEAVFKKYSDHLSSLQSQIASAVSKMPEDKLETFRKGIAELGSNAKQLVSMADAISASAKKRAEKTMSDAVKTGGASLKVKVFDDKEDGLTVKKLLGDMRNAYKKTGDDSQAINKSVRTKLNQRIARKSDELIAAIEGSKDKLNAKEEMLEKLRAKKYLTSNHLASLIKAGLLESRSVLSPQEYMDLLTESAAE